jgi:exopolysaccharide biosynthesis protein
MLPTVSSQKRTPCTKFGRESDGPFIMFIPEEKEGNQLVLVYEMRNVMMSVEILIFIIV